MRWTVYAEIGIMIREPDDQASKALVILSGDIKTPPLSRSARREIGYLIRKLQHGLSLEMPQSRPMPAIGPRCHELRVNDGDKSWRVIYRTDRDAVLVNSDYLGEGYGLPTPATFAALRKLAGSEGLLLDPVYSGKAMSGFLGLLESGRFDDVDNLVFLHTGGTASLHVYGQAILA